MDTTTQIRIANLKYRLKEWAPVIAVIAACVSTLFIGISIGTVTERADALRQQQQITAFHSETLAAKDELIGLLTRTTVKAADAAVGVATEVGVVAIENEEKAKQSEHAARLAKAREDAARAKADAAEARRRAEQRKLKGLR